LVIERVISEALVDFCLLIAGRDLINISV
jgi:hypothetical protein